MDKPKATVDSLGRRLRERKVSKGGRFYLQPRDIEWFHFLHKHGGMLATSYLYEYTKATHRSKPTATRRLCNLFTELNMIDRPQKQFETLDPRSNELVHQLNDESYSILEWKDLYSKFAPATTGAFKHQLMTGSITASFELNARATENVKYIPQNDILTKPLSIPTPYGELKPDSLFALEIDGKRMLCFVEADRSTEPTRSTGHRKTWENNLKQYQYVIGEKFYKEFFDVTCGALLLIFTVSTAKRDGILDLLGKETSYILAHHMPQFGYIFEPPAVMNLLTQEYQRNGKPFKFI